MSFYLFRCSQTFFTPVSGRGFQSLTTPSAHPWVHATLSHQKRSAQARFQKYCIFVFWDPPWRVGMTSLSVCDPDCSLIASLTSFCCMWVSMWFWWEHFIHFVFLWQTAVPSPPYPPRRAVNAWVIRRLHMERFGFPFASAALSLSCNLQREAERES